PFGGGVGGLVVAQGADDRLDHVLRGVEVELAGVADVQADDRLARRFGLPGEGDDVTDGVGDVLDAPRDADRGVGQRFGRVHRSAGVRLRVFTTSLCPTSVSQRLTRRKTTTVRTRTSTAMPAMISGLRPEPAWAMPRSSE